MTADEQARDATLAAIALVESYMCGPGDGADVIRDHTNPTRLITALAGVAIYLATELDLARDCGTAGRDALDRLRAQALAMP